MDKRHAEWTSNITESKYHISDFILLRWSASPVLALIWHTTYFLWFTGHFAYNYRNFKKVKGYQAAMVEAITQDPNQEQSAVISYNWKALAFLTRWAELLNVVYAVFAFVVVGTTVFVYNGLDLFEEKSTVYHEVLGGFFQVQAASSFSISFFFYSVIYTKKYSPEHFTYQSINLHFLQSVQ